MRRLLSVLLLSFLLGTSSWGQNQEPQLAIPDPTRVLICFDSVDGHTEILANWIQEGAKAVANTEVRLKRVDKVLKEDLVWADAIIVGSPVYNGMTTPAVGKFLADWPFENNPLKNKVGCAFVAAKGASAGEETTLLSILQTMLVFQMVVVGGDDWRSAYGVSYILDISTPQVLGFTKDKAIRLGRRASLVAASTRGLRQGPELR